MENEKFFFLISLSSNYVCKDDTRGFSIGQAISFAEPAIAAMDFTERLLESWNLDIEEHIEYGDPINSVVIAWNYPYQVQVFCRDSEGLNHTDIAEDVKKLVEESIENVKQQYQNGSLDFEP